MVAKKTVLAWGYYSKEKGVYPEAFQSRTDARCFKDDQGFDFSKQYKLVRIQLKPFVKK